MSIGKRIIHYRTQRGMTQKALAEKMGISSTRLNYWEKDKREPDVKMINLLCKNLEIDPNRLLSEDAKTPPAPDVPEQGEEKVSMRAVEDFLVSFGYIQPGGDLTDSDVRIINSILDILDAWFQEER